MSKRMIGVVLLLVGSEALGLLGGNWFFGVFTATVPAAVVTDFNRAAAYGYFLMHGILLGLAVFGWALLALVLARFFRPAAGGPAERERVADGRGPA
jgi:hypothetical protein